MIDAAESAVIDAALALIDALARESNRRIWDIDRIPADLLTELNEASKKGAYTYEETLMKRVLPGVSDSGPCERCDECVDAGWIDSEDVYPTGDDGPGFHPHCVCEEFYRVGRVRVYESGLRVRESWVAPEYRNVLQ